MNLGVDWYNTFTAYPQLFKMFIEKSYKTFIISAVRKENIERVKSEAAVWDMDGSLVVVEFDKWDDIPRLKWEAAKDLGLDVMIDDNEHVCRHFIDNGVLALQPLALLKPTEPKADIIRHKTFEEAKAYNLRRYHAK